MSLARVLADLNPQQRKAVQHGEDPLLIVAGAGTGKTATLVHRVAWLIANGVPPGHILLLTFTRRAAAEMVRRAGAVLRRVADKGESVPMPGSSRVWGGTFHAIATRLLRRYGKAVGLNPRFTIHDRSDSEDLMNVLRSELGLAKTKIRFPQKATCMDIYSRCVNGREKLEDVVCAHFSWCKGRVDELKELFDAYVARKEAQNALDYDDLLVFWHALLTHPQVGPKVRSLFHCVLVDEYQDTNALQAEIIYALCPDGRGLTVVGDDAQSIYSFRGATVRNILDFPKHYPNTTVATLEQNYRSTQPILRAANAVIGLASQRYIKHLWSEHQTGQVPRLVTCEDEDDQAQFVANQVLEHREEGILLRRQAVLFRTAHHSMVLEAELAQRNIPFHKYGGLKFVETAHVKDLLAVLRLAENPRDEVAGTRLLLLLPGIGPVRARQLLRLLAEAGGDFQAWYQWRPPEACESLWPKLIQLLQGLATARQELPAQVHQVRLFYTPLLELHYDNPSPRARDLEQLEEIAARYGDRPSMLAEIALDPPSSTQDLAGPPQRDDDYLVLSTIHSAKGLEWDVVYVIHAADGCIPSDMATESPDQIEEELRLFYVALTRAKSCLYVCHPLRFFRGSSKFTDAHGLSQLTRFLPKGVQAEFRRVTWAGPDDDLQGGEYREAMALSSQRVRDQIRSRWS